MPRPRARTLVPILIPVAILFLLLGAWAVDTRGSDDHALRSVEVDGRPVGGASESELDAEIGRVAEDFADTPVRINSAGRTLTSTAGDLGLSVDERATAAAALDEGRDGHAFLRPLTWAASLVSSRGVPARYRIRRDVLILTVASLEGEENRRPVEPSVVASPDAVTVKAGRVGMAIDADDLADRLLDAARAEEDPLSVKAEPVARKPRITDERATAVAKDLETKTSAPLTVKVRDKTVVVPAAQVRSWVSARAQGNDLVPVVDLAQVDVDIRELVGELGGAPRNASVTLVNGVPQITPSQDGIACCAPDTASLISQTILVGKTQLTIKAQRTRPALTTETVLKYGIREPIGTITEWKGQPQVKSFTTYHAGGESRVTNIHRIADLVRGAVIPPGKTFSVNQHVGRRTTDKGFVEAGVIADGKLDVDVGGGVSQFATTLFNAAFFAGMDFGEYQSHSLVIDRYPRGREATLGFEHPDLQIENPSPYGVLIWTSYTDTSITVTLYSTPWRTGQQTGQSQAPNGNCTRVTTARTLTYVDGRTAQDSVRANYRPGEGVDC